MKKHKITNWILAIGYCLPVTLLAVFIDWVAGNVIGYWFAFGFLIALFFLTVVEKKAWLALVGNIVSTAISYGISLVLLKPEEWASYSKMYTPQGWILTVSAVIFAVQLLFWLLIKKISKKKERS